jgi:hypothetical protein
MHRSCGCWSAIERAISLCDRCDCHQSGGTALSKASERDCVVAVEALVKAGADLNHQGKVSQFVATTLFMSARRTLHEDMYSLSD